MAATSAGDDFSRYGGTTTSIPKFDVPEAAEPARPPARYNPRGWSIRKRFLVGGGIVTCLAIIGIVVGAVVGTRRREENYNDYPVYRPLGYALVDEYTPSNFFDRFNYYSDVDPTKGFVDYVDGPTARALNLTSATASSAVLRVDASTANATRGRRSVRLESTAAYDRGLFVFDIVHTPYGCGTWPALWLTDPAHWPEHGEIDVLETTNRGSEGNAVTLHTGGKCMMDGERRQEGTAGEYVNCDNSTHSNAGCGVEGGPGTYGEEMNAGGGGVYALELRPAGIRAWYFPRDSIPDDIDTDTSASNGSIVPDPSSWPTPLADFPGTNCDIAAQFRNQSIIANIDLCGELGAQPRLYKELYGCPATCEEFVAQNPGNFTEAYWQFRSFRVYQVD